MRQEIIMTPEEFAELANRKNEPNQLLEETIINLTDKLSLATVRITELEKENSMYAIGGAKKHTPLMNEVVQPTSMWAGYDQNRLKTYAQEYNRLSKLGEDFTEWHVDNLAEELGRTSASVKSKARSLGYSISKGYIVRK